MNNAQMQGSFASRPGTQYLPEMGNTGPLMADLGRGSIDHGGDGPSDLELEAAAGALLSGADLNSITKREVRRRLEQQFGCDLAARKAVINAAIDRHLAG